MADPFADLPGGPAAQADPFADLPGGPANQGRSNPLPQQLHDLYMRSPEYREQHPLAQQATGGEGNNPITNALYAARNSVATGLNQAGNELASEITHPINYAGTPERKAQEQFTAGLNQQEAAQTAANYPVDPTRTSATVGGVGGSIAEASIPGVGPYLFAASRAGENLAALNQAKLAGQNISPLQETGFMAANVAGDVLGGKVIGGEGATEDAAISNAGPAWANKNFLGGIDQGGVLGKTVEGAGNRALRAAGGMQGLTYLQNAAAIASGVDPARSIFQGIPENTLGGLGGGALHGGIEGYRRGPTIEGTLEPEQRPDVSWAPEVNRRPEEDQSRRLTQDQPRSLPAPTGAPNTSINPQDFTEGVPPWQGDVAVEQAKVAAEEAKAAAAHVADLHQRLGQEAVAPRPEHGVGEPPPREKPNEAVEETPGFVKPEDVPQTAEDKEVGNGFFKRLRDLQPENEQRLTENPQPPEGQPERRAFAGATFESPEEAGANKFFSDKRATVATPPVQEAAVEQAVQDQERGKNEEKEEEPEYHDDFLDQQHAEDQEREGNPGLYDRFMGDESGGTKAFNNVVERDIKPPVTKLWEGLKAAGRVVDRETGAGLTETPESKSAHLNLREALGDAELNSHKFAAALAPALKHVPSFSKDPQAAIKWAENFEAGGDGGIKAIAPIAGIIRKMKQDNAKEAAKLGITHLDPTGNTLNRLATFPGDGKGGGSIAGNNDRLRAQKLEKFGDFVKAVEAKNGKLDYDDPVSMQIAGQFEFAKRIAAEKALRGEEKAGVADWVPEGGTPQPGHVELEDPVIGHQDRDVYWPRWKGGRFGNMKGGFKADKFREQHTSNPVAWNEGDPVPSNGEAIYLRPGETPPAGYANSGKTISGSFHAPENVAAKYNNLLPAPSKGKIFDGISAASKAAFMLHYGASLLHGVNGLTNLGLVNAGRGAKRLVSGDWQGAAKSFANAFTGGVWKGTQIERAIRQGTAGDIGERVAGTDVAQLSPKTSNSGILTNKSWWPAAKDEFKNQNPIGGVGRIVKGIWNTSNEINFRHMIEKGVLGNLAEIAEDQAKKGLTQEEGRADLAKRADLLADLTGHQIRSRGFQNGVIRDITRIFAPAARFHEGQARVATQALLDSNDSSGGTASKVQRAISYMSSPAKAYLAAQLAGTALVGTALCLAFTGKPPRNTEDAFNPPIGNKDADGNEERFTLPGLGSQIYRWVYHTAAEAKGTVSTIVTGGYETVANKDWQGEQVRPDDASHLSNTLSGVRHVTEGLAPISASPLLHRPAGEDWWTTAKKTLEGVTGIGRTSHPETSDAMNELYDQLSEGHQQGRDLAAQHKLASNKKWVNEIAAGNEDQAEQEMEDVGINKHEETSVFEQARQRQQGKWSRVMDSDLKPSGLIRIWNAATPEEQSQMKEFLQQRLSRDHGSEDADEQAAWDKLEGLVGQ